MASPKHRSKARVLVVGSCSIDMIVRVDKIPGIGETVIGGKFHSAGGGKGANQAAAAALCGAAVTLLGRVGDDALGAARKAALASLGVDTNFLGMTSDAMTGVAFITVTPDGENAIVVASGANLTLSPGDADSARVSSP